MSAWTHSLSAVRVITLSPSQKKDLPAVFIDNQDLCDMVTKSIENVNVTGSTLGATTGVTSVPNPTYDFNHASFKHDWEDADVSS